MEQITFDEFAKNLLTAGSWELLMPNGEEFSILIKPPAAVSPYPSSCYEPLVLDLCERGGSGELQFSPHAYNVIMTTTYPDCGQITVTGNRETVTRLYIAAAFYLRSQRWVTEAKQLVTVPTLDDGDERTLVRPLIWQAPKSALQYICSLNDENNALNALQTFGIRYDMMPSDKTPPLVAVIGRATKDLWHLMKDPQAYVRKMLAPTTNASKKEPRSKSHGRAALVPA